MTSSCVAQLSYKTQQGLNIAIGLCMHGPPPFLTNNNYYTYPLCLCPVKRLTLHAVQMMLMLILHNTSP